MTVFVKESSESVLSGLSKMKAAMIEDYESWNHVAADAPHDEIRARMNKEYAAGFDLFNKSYTWPSASVIDGLDSGDIVLNLGDNTIFYRVHRTIVEFNLCTDFNHIFSLNFHHTLSYHMGEGLSREIVHRNLLILKDFQKK